MSSEFSHFPLLIYNLERKVIQIVEEAPVMETFTVIQTRATARDFETANHVVALVRKHGSDVLGDR